MSGKPAARQGDMTQYGGSIVQGSAGVRIGAPTGVACSVCPGGVTSGHPVNPLLGAKVLPGETDIALPGPLPFILSRTYSSYRTKTPAPVGSLGPGWKMPADIRLQLRDNTLILSDNGGRSLYFEHLFPGEDGYDHDRFGQMTAVHREEGLSQYRAYDSRGQLIAVKDTQGHETRYEYNAAGDLTTVIAPDGSRNGTQYDAWGKAVRTTQGGLTRSMEYDAAGRVIRLTSENGSHTTFRYDVLDRLIQETGFDGRTQRYHHDLTGKLIRSEDEGLVTHWHYDEADRLTHRTVKGETAERWRYDERGWLTDISHISEGHRVAVHYRYDEKGRL
ncbi:DUF6531 domain-containing protein, partial [Escherichia coli]